MKTVLEFSDQAQFFLGILRLMLEKKKPSSPSQPSKNKEMRIKLTMAITRNIQTAAENHTAISPVLHRVRKKNHVVRCDTLQKNVEVF